MQFRFHSDPGHGWAAVPRSLLVQLGIADKITHYSYQRGDTVYLEEDCDLTTFMEAAEKAGMTVTFRGSICSNRSSRIRGYDRYTNLAIA